MKIEIYQPKKPGCNNSFWYDGLVATAGKIYMYAVGEKQIYNKNNKLVYDNIYRKNLQLPEFKNGLKNDKDLLKLEKYGYRLVNNSKFRIWNKKLGIYEECSSYDDGLKLLKLWAKKK